MNMGIFRTINEHRRRLGLWASVLLAIALVIFSVHASGPSPNVAVSFVDYDMDVLDGSFPSGPVPDGAMLYTAADLKHVDGFQPSDGCTWYLYKEADDGQAAFGPAAIPDPQGRVGYEFYDWASLNTTNADQLHTVDGSTVFMARYARSCRYLVSFYYQYSDENHSVAAPTTSIVGGLGDQLSMSLPQLDTLSGLTPQIRCLYEDEAGAGVAEAKAAAAQINTMLQNGVFSATLDEQFLELCRSAWFVEWDTNTGNYKLDNNGVVRINIPVIYAFDGTTSFEVHYYLQGADDPRSYEPVESDFETVQISGSTHVSLEALDLVKKYEGFSLNPVSRQHAASYTVNPNGSTIIDLYYDRDVYYVTYQLHGGNLQEPVAFRYGQTLPTSGAAANDLLAPPVRAGYTFTGWTYRTSHGAVLDALPATMPAYDMVLEANWVPATTTITITYWLENANDDDYTPVASRKIPVPTESIVGYAEIAPYLTSESMAEPPVNITDGAYFSLVDHDGKAIPTVTAAGDGSTTINAYYDRKEYTLVFHIGWIGDGTNGTTDGWYYVSTAGNSNTKNDPMDWTSGYSGWKAGAKNVTLTMDGQTYNISNDTETCYQITAKYGSFIGDRWPVANEQTVPQTVSADNATYQLFTWGTHASSPYFQNREDPPSNKNIMGVYSTMSAELIIDANRPDVAHHLTAYWAKIENKGAGGSGNGEYKIHHYLFEAVPGAMDPGTSSVAFQDVDKGYQKITVSQNTDPNAIGISDMEFYSYQDLQVRTTHTSAGQNPPAFSNLTFQYGCYDNENVYFFYTYDDYTLTYDENNPDLTDDSPESHQNVTFHYVSGKPLKDTMLADAGFVHDYTPDQPYVCQYGNEHLFAGWYKDPACTIPIEWEYLASESSVTAYAKWDSPSFDLTLEIPNGSLPDDILYSIQETYDVDAEIRSDGCTYTIRNVIDGTPINQVLGQSQQPVSQYGLPFQDWYETDQDGLSHRFLFDDSQVMNGHRTLTARWVEQDTGVYTVRYLTLQDPHNGLECVEVDGVVYYRLRQDEMMSGLAVGSTVTLEPKLISGYLPTHGSLTQVITSSRGTPVIFDFVYTPMGIQAVSYTVHYVLDTGEDYGRTAASSSVSLADSVTFTLSPDSYRMAPGSITGSVRAIAIPLPGYVPRDGHLANMVLSSTAAENHLYFYYVSNADTDTDLGLGGEGGTHGVPCRVEYYIWDDHSGAYMLEDTMSMESSVGTILYAAPFAEQYLNQVDVPGLSLDRTHTSSSVVVSIQGNNILPIYLRAPSAGDPPPDTSWDRPTDALPDAQPDYKPTPPPTPDPGDGDTGDGDTGGGDTGGGDTGDGDTGGGDIGGGDTGDGNTGGDDADGSDTGDGDITYYILRYESNGGTVYPSEQYAPNHVVVLDKIPLRAGCRFTGWYADAALTQPVTTVTMTSSRTVYAGWEPSAVPELLNGEDHFAYVIGYTDGTVRPLAHITREEVAAIFFRLLDPEIRASALTDHNSFTDVAQSDWSNQAISTLNLLGIFHGRSTTLFDGSAPITRAEFAAVCARFDQSGTGATHSFTDLEGHWASEEIGRAAALGWILGYEDGTFRPDQPITRAEAMTMVNRVLHRLPETAGDLLPDMTVWPDNPPEAWHYLAVQEATNTHAYTFKDTLYEAWTQLLEDPDWTQYQ